MPRLPSYRLKQRALTHPVQTLCFDQLPGKNLSLCGLVGSPTHVENMFAPPANAKKVLLTGNTTEKVASLITVLKEKRLLEGGVRA